MEFVIPIELNAPFMLLNDLHLMWILSRISWTSALDAISHSVERLVGLADCPLTAGQRAKSKIKQ